MAKQVLLQFNLDEEVTPEIFALRVSDACHKYYALRENETVTVYAALHEVKWTGK